MSALTFHFPGPGTAAFFAAALGIFAAYQVRNEPQFFWMAVLFSLAALVTGVAVEYTDKQRENMTWRAKLPLTLVGLAITVLLVIALVQALRTLLF